MQQLKGILVVEKSAVKEFMVICQVNNKFFSARANSKKQRRRIPVDQVMKFAEKTKIIEKINIQIFR